MDFKQWEGFTEGAWKETINVKEFIHSNYTAYEGDASFLCEATERTKKLYAKLEDLFQQEREKGGVLEVGFVEQNPILLKNGEVKGA